jgi:hypothetical protein
VWHILPVVGAAGDLAVDGAEVVLGSLVIVSLLGPRRPAAERAAAGGAPSESYVVVDDDPPDRGR